jgi:hypothetical protein
LLLLWIHTEETLSLLYQVVTILETKYVLLLH